MQDRLVQAKKTVPARHRCNAADPMPARSPVRATAHVARAGHRFGDYDSNLSVDYVTNS
jgi:hypothetical protein